MSLNWRLNLICVLLCISGCRSGPEVTTGPDPISTFDKTKDRLFAEAKPSTERLVELMGEPDLKLEMGEFYELLRKSKSKSATSPDANMDMIYEAYLLRMGVPTWQERPTPGNWRESEKFNGLSIWLYHWYEPFKKTIYLGCSLCPQKLVYGYYFLVDGSQVIDVETIDRRKRAF